MTKKGTKQNPTNRWPGKIHCITFVLAASLVSVALSWLGASVVRAQASCACPSNRVNLGVIQVKVKAQGEGNSRFWVLGRFPDENDLQIGDSGLKQRVISVIAQSAASGGAEQFGFNDAAPNNFTDLLNLKFTPEDDLAPPGPKFFPAPELIAVPGATDGTFSICVCGLPGITPPTASVSPEQYRVFVVLKTASATQETELSSSLPIKRVEQATVTVDNIPVILFFTRQDLRHAAADPQARAKPQDRVIAELTAVAKQLLALARARQLLDAAGKLQLTPEIGFNSESPFEIIQKALIPNFTRNYELSKQSANSPLMSAVKWRPLEVSIGGCLQKDCAGGPSEPCNQLCTTPHQPTFVLAVTGLQIVRHVALKVQPDDIDRKFPDKEIGQEFNEQRRTIAKKLNLEFKGMFKAQPGHVVTWEQIESDRQLLCPPAGGSTSTAAKCKAVGKFLQISSPAKRQPPRNQPTNLPANLAANTSDNADTSDDFSNDSALIYEVERKRKTPGALSISAGGLYSPADSFLGTVGVKEYNLLGLQKFTLGERASLDYSRGDQVQKIRFQLARPFVAPDRAGWRVKDVSISLNYLRDRQQRLSNLTPAEIEARETGSSAAFAFGYDSFKRDDYQLPKCDDFKACKRAHATLHGETSLGFRDLNIPESRKLLALTGLRPDLLPQASTQMTPLALNLTATLTRDSRQPGRAAGLGHLNFSLETKLQRGLGWFGADYRYYKTAVTGRAEIVFGARSPEDFFLRLTQGLGQSGDGTPVTELFRLGGLSNVRGMEEGEFIGRRLRFAQAEFGVNALSLWNLLRKPEATNPNRTSSTGTETARSPLPFDPANIYLKTFYDFAHISDPTSFSGAGLAPRPLDRSVNGYGIALELRNLGNDLTAPLSFSFGYARSPQSVLHRAGTLFTGVSYSF